MVVGKIDGTYDFGACGIVPKVVLPIPKPKLASNGYGQFVGHPKVNVPGLAEAVKGGSGHVMIFYSDGGKFGTFACNGHGNDTYVFA